MNRYFKNAIANIVIKLVATLLITLLLFIIGYLIYEIIPLVQITDKTVFDWHQLWQKTHYLDYAQAGYYWQPDATVHSQAKYSLVPLLVGSLKGASYGLLFATPFALGSAIYVSRFLHQGLANYIKGAIELLASFPTVVLAFLGLTVLAPLFENVFIVLLVFLLTPVFIVVLFSLLHWISPIFTHWSQEWQRLLSVCAVTALIFLLCFYYHESILLYSAQLMHQLTQKFNLDYHRYNTLVVSVAMAIAILPLIFTIAEDAFSSVPKTLIENSLALGATSWQTVVKIILPMAGPGIIVALMMGLMRALGETMIVLIAVDQTPVTNWHLFEGLRSITSALMVELNHVNVTSVHYHVLFLAAFLLFILTLLMNTIAELIRYQLKRKYNHW